MNGLFFLSCMWSLFFSCFVSYGSESPEKIVSNVVERAEQVLETKSATVEKAEKLQKELQESVSLDAAQQAELEEVQSYVARNESIQGALDKILNEKSILNDPSRSESEKQAARDSIDTIQFQLQQDMQGFSALESKTEEILSKAELQVEEESEKLATKEKTESGASGEASQERESSFERSIDTLVESFLDGIREYLFGDKLLSLSDLLLKIIQSLVSSKTIDWSELKQDFSDIEQESSIVTSPTNVMTASSALRYISIFESYKYFIVEEALKKALKQEPALPEALFKRWLIFLVRCSKKIDALDPSVFEDLEYAQKNARFKILEFVPSLLEKYYATSFEVPVYKSSYVPTGTFDYTSDQITFLKNFSMLAKLEDIFFQALYAQDLGASFPTLITLSSSELEALGNYLLTLSDYISHADVGIFSELQLVEKRLSTTVATVPTQADQQ